MKIKDDKESAATIARDTLQQSDEDLLRDIFHQYNIAFSKNDPAQINRTIAYFSALLIKLSRQAEESTKQTIKLTKQLLYLTWFIAILTAILLFIGVFEFTKKPVVTYLNPGQKTEQPQDNYDKKQPNHK